MFKPIFSAIFSVLFLSVAAQEKISADRPDQSDGTSIVKKRSLQLESELYVNTFTLHHPAIISSSLLRYGVSKKFEARIVAEQGQNRDLFIDETVQGVYPLAIGFKYQFIDDQQPGPAVALITHMQLPVTNTKENKGYWSPSFILSLEKKFGNFNITTNSGIKQDAFDSHWSWPMSVDLKYELGKEVEVFTEYFSQYARVSVPDHNADLGISWKCTKRMMLYTAAGCRIFTDEHNYFVNSGIAVNF